MTAISNIFIYTEPRCRAIDYASVAAYIQEKLPFASVSLREPLMEKAIIGDDGDGAAERLAVVLAKAKVRSLDGPTPGDQRALRGEIDYELRRLKNRESGVFGILYDAWMIADVYRSLLTACESRLGDVNLIFTNQLIGNWDSADNRYHARTVVCGAPSIVSTNGMVVAPAKSPGFYIARRSSEVMGLQEEEKMELARSCAGDCLEADDPRLTDVAKGLAMQAVAYRLTGKPFCDDKDCRLFNAHWQSELLESQLGGGYEYCRGHSEILAGCLAEGETPWT